MVEFQQFQRLEHKQMSGLKMYVLIMPGKCCFIEKFTSMAMAVKMLTSVPSLYIFVATHLLSGPPPDHFKYSKDFWRSGF